jgi:NADPH:quinone reductase
MQAIRAHRFGSADVLVLDDVPAPVPASGQILIRVSAASVNYADLIRRRNGAYPFPTALPFTPGSEVAGTVEVLGAGVSGPAVGTPVFSLAGVGADAGSTGYAQFVLAEASQVIPIPPGLSPEVACGLIVAGSTAMLMLRNVAQLQPGETVLVHGAAGGVGSLAIQLAAILGARHIIAGASQADRRDRALELGATHVFDSTHAAWPAEVRKLTDGRGVDVVLEMRGGLALEESLAVLAPFGRAVVYGMASDAPVQLSERALFDVFHVPAQNHSMIAFNLGLWFALRASDAIDALSSVIGYVASGRVRVPIHEVLPLAQAADAHRLLEGRRAMGKVILRPWPEA